MLLASASVRAQPACTGTTASVSPMDCGAKCDGVTDDSSAFAAWWSYLMTHKAQGTLPAATCRITTPQTWNMARRASGLRVTGAGSNLSVLDLTNAQVSVPLQLTGGGTDLFYGDFENFTVLTRTPGPGVQLGRPTLTDALNGFIFKQVEFKNAARDPAAIALEVNGCFNCDFQMVTTNTGGASITGTGQGESLRIAYAAFSRFQGSFSSAAVGIHLTQGYVFGNVFEALDLENVNTAVLIDSPRAARNTFVGGQYGAMVGLDFAAGSANLVINPNLAAYPDGAPIARTIGLSLQQPGQPIATPKLPPSGVTVTNNTGRTVAVTVFGGSATSIRVGAAELGLTQGMVIVPAGQRVSVTYTAPPAWVWTPIQ